MDRALEAVKDMGLTRCDYLEGKTVIIPADFTFSHLESPL
jgi:hypothetical protein